MLPVTRIRLSGKAQSARRRTCEPVRAGVRSIILRLAVRHGGRSPVASVARFPQTEVIDADSSAVCQGRLNVGPLAPVEKWATLSFI